MSRSGYSECGGDYLNLYRGTVERAIKGKRGQTFLRELAAAMDAMPEKRLNETIASQAAEIAELEKKFAFERNWRVDLVNGVERLMRVIEKLKEQRNEALTYELMEHEIEFVIKQLDAELEAIEKETK